MEEVFLKGIQLFLVDFPESYIKAICPICKRFAGIRCKYDGQPINPGCEHCFIDGTKQFCGYKDCNQGWPKIDFIRLQGLDIYDITAICRFHLNGCKHRKMPLTCLLSHQKCCIYNPKAKGILLMAKFLRKCLTKNEKIEITFREKHIKILPHQFVILSNKLVGKFVKFTLEVNNEVYKKLNYLLQIIKYVEKLSFKYLNFPFADENLLALDIPDRLDSLHFSNCQIKNGDFLIAFNCLERFNERFHNLEIVTDANSIFDREEFFINFNFILQKNVLKKFLFSDSSNSGYHYFSPCSEFNESIKYMTSIEEITLNQMTLKIDYVSDIFTYSSKLKKIAITNCYMVNEEMSKPSRFTSMNSKDLEFIILKNIFKFPQEFRVLMLKGFRFFQKLRLIILDNFNYTLYDVANSLNQINCLQELSLLKVDFFYQHIGMFLDTLWFCTELKYFSMSISKNSDLFEQQKNELFFDKLSQILITTNRIKKIKIKGLSLQEREIESIINMLCQIQSLDSIEILVENNPEPSYVLNYILGLFKKKNIDVRKFKLRLNQQPWNLERI